MATFVGLGCNAFLVHTQSRLQRTCLVAAISANILLALLLSHSCSNMLVEHVTKIGA